MQTSSQANRKERARRNRGNLNVNEEWMAWLILLTKARTYTVGVQYRVLCPCCSPPLPYFTICSSVCSLAVCSALIACFYNSKALTVKRTPMMKMLFIVRWLVSNTFINSRCHSFSIHYFTFICTVYCWSTVLLRVLAINRVRTNLTTTVRDDLEREKAGGKSQSMSEVGGLGPEVPRWFIMYRWSSET